MRFRRSRRRNLILLSTRAVVPSGPRGPARAVRRRRFRLVRTGCLLAVIGAARLVQSARSHWRISLALCGLLLQVAGHSVLAGPAHSAADLLGLVLILTAALKGDGPAGDRRRPMPQTAWRWHG
jgi:hypothetical protein